MGLFTKICTHGKVKPKTTIGRQIDTVHLTPSNISILSHASNIWSSRAVSHPVAIQAQCCSASVFEWLTSVQSFRNHQKVDMVSSSLKSKSLTHPVWCRCHLYDKLGLKFSGLNSSEYFWARQSSLQIFNCRDK